MVRTIGISLISWLALAGLIGLALLFFITIVDKVTGSRMARRVRTFIAPRAYTFAFALSFIATLASLFLSEVLHFQPCVLCWYQRIAMYPQTLLLYIALMRNERTLTPYLVAINILGLFVALYHYMLHVLPRTMVQIMPCSTAVGGVPCDKGYDLYFGFMTFPLMSAVVFSLILVCLYYSHVKTRTR